LNVEKNNLDGPAKLYRIKDARGELGFISAISQHFCQSCNRLRLTADGNMRACLFSDQEVDLKNAMRMGCSDSELVNLIKTAAETKPGGFKETADEGHIKKCTKDMSAIGG